MGFRRNAQARCARPPTPFRSVKRTVEVRIGSDSVVNAARRHDRSTVNNRRLGLPTALPLRAQLRTDCRREIPRIGQTIRLRFIAPPPPRAMASVATPAENATASHEAGIARRWPRMSCMTAMASRGLIGCPFLRSISGTGPAVRRRGGRGLWPFEVDLLD